MQDIWLVTGPILLVDVVNPVLLALVIVLLTGQHPIARSLALIVGHTLAYFLFGVLVVYGLVDLLAPILQKIGHWVMNPEPISFVASFVLGVVLIVLGLRWKSDGAPKREAAPQVKGGIGQAFVLGATASVVGAPFAVPYFGFINEMFRFEVESKMSALVLYNLAYATPFLILPLIYKIWGQSVVGALKSLKLFLEDAGKWVLPVLFGLLGLGFVVDALLFFLTGEGLI